MNEDLRRERERCTFNPQELTHLLDGGKEKTEERKQREKFFLEDPELKYTTPPEYLSHKEKYEEGLKKACIIFKKVQELQAEGKGGMENFREILGGQLGSAVLKDGNPLTLHYVMFIPTLMGQGTIEQQAHWISRAWNLEIIGTYAQTELGHGTFIRGLETTATYDPKTEEFVLNSPTLTSYKWWPGGLGHSANYAIVVAQLYTNGKCHGIHPFVVQLRDEETHQPLPGIIIGEIGCKLGMNATNNGYLGFKNVRVPREQMLMKNNKVMPDGSYIKAPSSKLTYGTMIFVRVAIVQDAGRYLRKAATIATRYSAVRHQSQIKEGAPEPQIIDFVTQQFKIFPQLASAFAFHFAGSWLWDMYNNVTSELETGKLDRLPELHAIACCLKAVSSADAAKGIEILRLACGGHGYMACSNLPITYGLVTAMETYEGENTVLYLQTARFLVKSWQSAHNGGQLQPTVQYLRDLMKNGNIRFEKNVPWAIQALKKVAYGKIDLAIRHLNERTKKGMEYDYAWNETSLELTVASEAHCRAFIVETFYNLVVEAVKNTSPQLGKVLLDLCDLYAVNTLLRNYGDLLRFAGMSSNDLEVIQTWLEELLKTIRPNAVGIVDGFDIHDDILSSPLGAFDGNVYERLFEEAQKSPLNKVPVNESFAKYLKPLLKSNL
ncbi:acyl-coenzyme A oxidase 1 [Onthophagus taurus]|uniref:acyl-coenzyme A oxidase 1 n=1 Tax=Onthophagus taurus TaxID=166361 RepID=UPI0039BE48B9